MCVCVQVESSVQVEKTEVKKLVDAGAGVVTDEVLWLLKALYQADGKVKKTSNIGAVG